MTEKEVILTEENFRQGNVSLILDSYDDLFSDFDPRPYHERAISGDFLDECKRAARDKEQGMELRLLIPHEKRKINEEVKIIKRFKSHFQKHFKEKGKEIINIRKEGIQWFLIGGAIIFASTFLYRLEGFLFNFLFVLSEPAGWFTLWTGLDKIFNESKKPEPDLGFNKKMSSAEISFIGYSP